MNAPNPSTIPRRRGLVSSVFLAGLSALVAGFLHLCITQSTAEFRNVGIVWSMIGTAGLACFLLPLTILAAVTVSFCERRRFLPWWICRKSIAALGVCTIVAAVLLGLNWSGAEARLFSATEGAPVRVANVQVAGFNSFLASRWLYSFEATEQDVVSIASTLRLVAFDKIDLKTSLERDVFFSQRAVSIAQGVPGRDASLAYASIDEHGQSVVWKTLVYSDSTRRAWLFMGFQN